MPPQTNARLLAVHDADALTGGLDDWDTQAAPGSPPAGAQKWAGDAPAYYRETVQRTITAGNVDVGDVRILWIDSTIARAASIDTDDVLTFTDPTGVQRTARASSVARSELAGIPSILQTTRLELEVR